VPPSFSRKGYNNPSHSLLLSGHGLLRLVRKTTPPPPPRDPQAKRRQGPIDTVLDPAWRDRLYPSNPQPPRHRRLGLRRRPLLQLASPSRRHRRSPTQCKAISLTHAPAPAAVQPCRRLASSRSPPLTRPPRSTEPAFRHLPRTAPGAAVVRHSRPASRSPRPHIPAAEHRPSVRPSPSHGPCTNVPSTSGMLCLFLLLFSSNDNIQVTVCAIGCQCRP
jgi:hypothetical protein